ncbi:hypothetical protein KAR91_53245 [Candidatus Pacearchaeota archaeon]|nr:hypothetical protein [Candidatus Pacearchaeota archaeon]
MAKLKKTQEDIQEEFDKQILELSDMQNRAGKKPLTHQQRCKMLNEIYDGTLVTLQMHLMKGVNKGTSAAVTMLERARLELIGLEEAHTRTNGKGVAGQHSMGYELPLPNEETIKA